MHKLFYTAAIPLLVSSAMAMEFTNAIDDEIENNANSQTSTPIEEVINAVDDEIENNANSRTPTPIEGVMNEFNNLEIISTASACANAVVDGTIPSLAINNSSIPPLTDDLIANTTSGMIPTNVNTAGQRSLHPSENATAEDHLPLLTGNGDNESSEEDDTV